MRYSRISSLRSQVSPSGRGFVVSPSSKVRNTSALTAARNSSKTPRLSRDSLTATFRSLMLAIPNKPKIQEQIGDGLIQTAGPSSSRHFLRESIVRNRNPFSEVIQFQNGRKVGRTLFARGFALFVYLKVQCLLSTPAHAEQELIANRGILLFKIESLAFLQFWCFCL